MSGLICGRPTHIARGCEAVEQFEADFERQLLASKRIDQRLEHTGKPWWLYAAKSFSKRSESRISCCQSVPLGQIDTWTEEAVNNRPDALSS